MSTGSIYLGIDIGGSGIKGATVDVENGQLTAKRYRIPTPIPATPTAVAEVVAEIVRHFDYHGPIGITFPSVVIDGVTQTAANVDDGWIGTDAAALFAAATRQPVFVLNDADAAGVAEMTFGAGKGRLGTVFVLTFGTGIGSALFTRGELVANTELGHIELGGREVEPWASDRARRKKGLSWKQWSQRVDSYLAYFEALFSPELFIIGGGVSKKSNKFFPRLSTQAPVVVAELRNEAGIVGAALMASMRLQRRTARKRTRRRRTSGTKGSSGSSAPSGQSDEGTTVTKGATAAKGTTAVKESAAAGKLAPSEGASSGPASRRTTPASEGSDEGQES
jgi:polyphosphate glucokinase